MSGQTDPRNPFSVSYLTEASLSAEELLSRYSFSPFRYLQSRVSDSQNVFLIGRKGVGKTMLLKLFAPELMSLLYSSEQDEHAKVRDLLPAGTVGVYLNLAAPTARLNLFQGESHPENWWRRAYADFLNATLLEQALRSIETMCAVPRWAARAGLTGPSILRDSTVTEHFLRGLREESSEYEAVRDVDELSAYLQERIKRWSRFVNGDPNFQDPPSTLLAIGRPLFRLTEAIQHARLTKMPFRLFVLIDQYEILHQRRGLIDYRPIFNEAMYSASRGGTAIEFKIGTRQYSYRNFNLPDGAGRIEANREMQEVDIDLVAEKFYREFAAELFTKRINSFSNVPRTQTHIANERLPGLEPLKEVELYLGNATGEEPRHLAAFLHRWSQMGLPPFELPDSQGRSSPEQTYFEALAAIAVARWLKGPRKTPPLHCPPSRANQLERSAAQYFADLIKTIRERTALGTAASSKGNTHLRAVENFVHDVQEAALFQLASAYKNQRKYYAGWDAILTSSSNVAIVLIEILQGAYEQLLLGGGDVVIDVVPPQTQSEAIYRTSINWFSRIPKECDFGETHQLFLKNLGALLRQVQLEITVPQPCPNGFSVVDSQLGSADDPLGSPRDNAAALFIDAVSWGLLEEEVHQHKTRGKPKRRKFYLNRVFCPYFGITQVRRKDPVYISDIQEFVDAVKAGKMPEDFQKVLARATKAPRAKGVGQRGLFE